MSTVKYVVPVPTNHNDDKETFDTLEEALNRVLSSTDTYGDIYLSIKIFSKEDK